MAVPPPFPIDFVWSFCTPLNNLAQKDYPAKNINDPNKVLVLKCHAVEDLKYSIRSAHQYMSWYANIVLILSDKDELPGYMKKAARNMRIVRHSEFVPKEFLPTFNSNVFESYIHKIPGLSEHFVYFNDDTYVCKPTPYTHFFTKSGKPINRHAQGAPNHSLEPHPYMFVKMMQNAIRKYGMQNTRYQHQVQPFTKSILHHYESKYAKELKKQSRNKYRVPTNFNLLRFSTCFSSTEGLAIKQETNNENDLFMESGEVTYVLPFSIKHPPRFLCINNSRPHHTHTKQLLQSLFTFPSPYERV